MNNGIPVAEAAYILNVSTNFVYRLIREDKLEVAQTHPILVTSRSVVKRLMTLQPFLEYALPGRLDYAVQRHAISGW